MTATLVAYVRSQIEWVRVGGRYTSIEGARKKLRESIAITNYYARSPTHITWDIAIFDPSVFALASTCGVPVPAILRELPDGVAFYTDSWTTPGGAAPLRDRAVPPRVCDRRALEAAKAETELMRPVVEAAERYRDNGACYAGIIPAVDAYRAARDKASG